MKKLKLKKKNIARLGNIDIENLKGGKNVHPGFSGTTICGDTVSTNSIPTNNCDTDFTC